MQMTAGQVERCKNGKFKKPNLATRVANYVTSTAVHIATGSNVADDTTYAHRRATCDACPSRNAANDSCKECGCSLHKTILGDKLRRATSTCPLNKWEATNDPESTAAA